MGNIITPDDLVSEGIGEESQGYERIVDLIAYAEHAVESIAGRTFHLISDTAQKVDGRGRSILRLPDPAIAITTVTISDEELASTNFEKVVGLNENSYLTAPRLRRTDGGVWPLGSFNVEITGSWGFVISDGAGGYEAPPTIKHLVKLIVVKMLTPLSEKVGDESTGPVKAESLGDYSYELAESAISRGEFGDREIDRLLNRYKRLGMASAGESQT